MLTPLRLTIFEILLLIFTSTLVITGIVIARIDVLWFENNYAVEDGFVENWTLVPLLIAAVYAITRIYKLRKYKTSAFIITMSFITVFSIFVAGEEISWGQRIFNTESSAFFKENNVQGETNLHNMVIGGTKINKLIFSQLMVVAVGFYLLILPYLYHRKSAVRAFCTRWGIPVARAYQMVACILLFVCISFIPSGKNAEILEAGITTLFLLIFLFPANKSAFELPTEDIRS